MFLDRVTDALRAQGGFSEREITNTRRLLQLGLTVERRTSKASGGVTFTPLPEIFDKREYDVLTSLGLYSLEMLQLCRKESLLLQVNLGKNTIMLIEKYLAEHEDGATLWGGRDFAAHAVAVYSRLEETPTQVLLLNALNPHIVKVPFCYQATHAAGLPTLGSLVEIGRQGVMEVLSGSEFSRGKPKAYAGGVLLRWLDSQGIVLPR